VSDRVSGAPAAEQRLLPNEPRIIDHDVQSELTERLLLPALLQLKAFFLAARAQVDAELLDAKPLKDGKPYPLGQCLEISCAVEARLPYFVAARLDGAATQGHAAFSAFLHAGGTFRLVWGDLRGEFFQNAFQLGTLYVDVANDTVTVTKPKVEILPFAEAGFLPVADFRHFGRIAARYWQHDVYPNHVLPTLAPYFPLIHIARMGAVSIRPANEYMLALTMAGRFRPSEDLLRDPAMPEDLFDHVAKALAGTGITIPANPDGGRAQALQACTDYREKRWHASSRQTETVISAALNTNRRLAIAGHVRPQSAADRPTSTVQNRPIDGYDIVSKTSHGNQRWFPTVGYRFAAGDMLCRLIAQELPKAIQTLPTGFIREGKGFVLVAILGLESGDNLYVDTDGRWLSSHIPALYRSHPFRMARADGGKSMLCVDTDNCVISRTKGHPFFADDGQAGAAVTDIVKFLGQVSANLRSTERACAALQAQGLIEPWPIQFRIHAGGKAIKGFFRIDETRLKQLDADALYALDQAGAFAMARAQLSSMRNLPALADLAQTRIRPDNRQREHNSNPPVVIAAAQSR
jgi:hypothetical protein